MAAERTSMRTRADIECWLTDMDGVLVHDNRPVPGAGVHSHIRRARYRRGMGLLSSLHANVPTDPDRPCEASRNAGGEHRPDRF